MTTLIGDTNNTILLVETCLNLFHCIFLLKCLRVSNSLSFDVFIISPSASNTEYIYYPFVRCICDIMQKPVQQISFIPFLHSITLCGRGYKVRPDSQIYGHFLQFLSTHVRPRRLQPTPSKLTVIQRLMDSPVISMITPTPK